MVWYIIYIVLTLLWDGLRLSRLSADDKTIEMLFLRQQLLILRRRQKRGPSISQGEKLVLITLLEPCAALGAPSKPGLSSWS
jgi:hypothetical protein